MFAIVMHERKRTGYYEVKKKMTFFILFRLHRFK